MVIDADELGLEPVIFAFMGGVVVVLGFIALVVAAVLAERGRHRFGLASFLMAWVLMVCVAADAYLVSRLKAGEVTAGVWLWTFGFGGLGALLVRQLWRRTPAKAQAPVE